MPVKLKTKHKTIKIAKKNSSSTSSEIANKTDFTDINDPFYQQNFTLKDDNLTDRYNQVLQNDFYIYNLPITFMDGLANLQEKKQHPMRIIPLFSRLIKGQYQTRRANYDTTAVRANVEFFVNNLPSFEKYQDKDKLDWVIKNHRLLAIEILEYYSTKLRKSLSTLEHRFNAILRLMRIAYGNKIAPIYKVFSVIVHMLKDAKQKDEAKNKLNEYEKKKFILWEDVMHIQSHMQKTFAEIKNKNTYQAYDYNNDLLLLSLYTLMPTLRNEIKFLKFSSNLQNTKSDYVYVSNDRKSVILKFNKRKKMHDGITYDLTLGKLKNPQLVKIILESYELYPRECLFTLKNKYPDVTQPATKRALDARLISIFFRHGIKNQISVNSLRSSFASYQLCNPNMQYGKKEHLAEQMRTSVQCLERSYKKIVDKEPVLAKMTKKDNNLADIQESPPSGISHSEPSEPSEPSEKSPNQYEKKLQRGREYYQKNKERLNAYQKEYNQKKTPFEKTRERLLQLLNASEDYAKKMRNSTKEKYKFVYNEQSKKWKWQE